MLSCGSNLVVDEPIAGAVARTLAGGHALGSALLLGEADGFGRILTGKIGADNVDGLSLRVNLNDDDLVDQGEDQGSVNLIFGVGRLLADELRAITDSFDGTIKNRERAIDDTIDDLDSRIADMERRIEQKRLNLVGRFASLEGSIATLQSQGNFLSSQLAGLK